MLTTILYFIFIFIQNQGVETPAAPNVEHSRILSGDSNADGERTFAEDGGVISSSQTVSSKTRTVETITVNQIKTQFQLFFYINFLHCSTKLKEME
jgi:hypothetical protein